MHTPVAERHDILHAIYHRRAVRAYEARQPDDGTIRELLSAAVQAPTAMHEEPWAFLVIQDKALLKRLSDRAKTMLLEEITTGGALAQHESIKRRMLPMLGDPGFNIFYDAGTLIVICAKPHGPYAKADCWLAAQNLMLAACAKELGTCCIGFAVPVLNHAEVRRELGIPLGVTAVAPIIIGYARAAVAPVPRKPPQLLRWIK